MIVQIGARLEEERKRLGFNQDQMAGLGGVAKRTYCNYEAGERDAGANLLAALAKVGADVQYIVTGVRSAVTLSQDEQELIAHFRGASLEVKAAALAGLKAGSKGTSKYALNFDGATIGQQVGSAEAGAVIVNKQTIRKK